MTAHANLLSRALDTGDLDRLRTRVRDRVPFYVRMQISSFEARTACLLNAMINGERRTALPTHTFFCSSTSEAISGALKIVRHNHFLLHPERVPITAVYDPTGNLKDTFDPLDGGIDEAMVPGIVYFEQWDGFCEYVGTQNPSSILLRHTDDIPTTDLDRILADAASRTVYTILDETSTDLTTRPPIASQLATLPDVIALGENLGANKVPIACFLMSPDIFKVWDTTKDYNLHSNTWGGNSASLATVLEHLKSTPAYASLAPAVIESLQLATESHLATTKMYETHCSPKMATMLNISGLNKDIRSAYRTQILTHTRRGEETVIDASGTYGVNLQGHNPDNVIDTVFADHDPEHDYWTDLQSLVHEKTGYAHIFPAVSGATSTEVALTMALLAAAPKKKIIALKGGFGGKTLLSLIATSRHRFKEPFGPLYPHNHYVDPFDEKGKDELLRYLETGDVAVVVMETVQGEGGVKAIPKTFLDFLQQQKEKYGFLIAVDEIQTGMYRTGIFLNHQDKVPATDIVLMGKAMSDNVFPVSATLCTDAVYQHALKTNAAALTRYENLYRCQFGAHMAMHAIRTGEELKLADHARTAGEYFLRKLRETTRDISFVKDVRGEGLMLGIEFEESKLPRLLRGSFGGLIASRCVNDSKQPVLVAFNPDKPFLIRFVPPLCITTEEIDSVIATFNRALRSGFFGLLKPIFVNTFNAKLGRI